MRVRSKHNSISSAVKSVMDDSTCRGLGVFRSLEFKVTSQWRLWDVKEDS